MRTSQQDELPPYFNINSDIALGELGGPATTEDFAHIAGACARGRTLQELQGPTAEGQGTAAREEGPAAEVEAGVTHGSSLRPGQRRPCYGLRE